MSFTEEIKRILFGYTTPQEYVCLDKKIESPLKVLLTSTLSAERIDVTEQHLLLGYKPLIIGIPGTDSMLHHLLVNTTEIQLVLSWNETVVAKLRMKQPSNPKKNDTKVFLFVGEHGEHKFLSPWFQFNNRQRERFKLFSKGNVFLSTNLYEQVRIAYSIPRQIAIVTLGGDGLFNIFPTDLHGRVGEKYYLSSLRKDGKVCDQVMRYKDICISSVPLSWKDKAYLLGKNHMKDPAALPEDILDKERSSTFQLPLPEGFTSYVELTWFDFIDIGIHRVFFYSVVSSNILRENGPTLHHIHRYYLQWRLNQKLPTSFELRGR